MGLSQFSLLFDGHLGIYAILKQIQIPESVYGKIYGTSGHPYIWLVKPMVSCSPKNSKRSPSTRWS